MAEIDAELGDQRLVEAELLPQLVDQLLVRRPGLAGDDAGRVAGAAWISRKLTTATASTTSTILTRRRPSRSRSRAMVRR